MSRGGELDMQRLHVLKRRLCGDTSNFARICGVDRGMRFEDYPENENSLV